MKKSLAIISAAAAVANAVDFSTAREQLLNRHIELGKEFKLENGAKAAPGFNSRCAIEDPTRTPIPDEYFIRLAPEYNAFAEAVRERLASLPPVEPGVPITKDQLWVWGGPHPSWGGSLQKDTLMRGARYFDSENGIYVYGPVTEEMISLHSGLKKMLVMVTNTCRAPGQQPESDTECAEKLSKLSLKYPNITGGMMDDMTNSLVTITPERVEQIAAVNASLKKHNPKLELYGTVYCHEIVEKDFAEVASHVDGVALWFWHQEMLFDLEKYVELCRQQFPGKKILLGMFIHDHGTADAATVNELLIYQLKMTRKLLAECKIQGLVILGDREILKWPEQSALVKGFLSAQF